MLVIDTGTGIDHFKYYIVAWRHIHKLTGARGAELYVCGSKCKRPCIRHGIPGIQHQGHDDLLQVRRIRFDCS